MLSTIAKRIQSRLSRQGVKVSLGEVKSQCELMINDIDNPSENELLAIQEYFMSAATSLTVINDISDVRTQSIQDTDDISNDDDSAIAVPSPNETITNEPAPLATATKSELVANTAGSLGIELSTTEIDHIANNFDNSSDDFTETLEQVKSAIIAYVQHKIASNNQKINEVVNEIGDVIADGFNQNNETLNNGLKQLNHQLNQQSTDFKSKLAGTLSRFQLPAAS
ncbi:MAG: hypothetical protein ACKPHV_20615 [Microcystis panniformis]